MRFQVAKQDLEAALAVVTPSLSSSGSDITTHYVFRRTGSDASNYGFEVVTLSGRVFASCPIKVKVEDPGDTKRDSFTIEGKRLKQFLAHIPQALLTFVFDPAESEVQVRSGKLKPTFPSLKPDSRFTWDATLKDSKLIATVPAARLAAALDYAKSFASAKESEQPEMCVVEAKEGVIYATDRKAVALVRVDGMKDSNLRIHRQDAPGLVAFLATFDGTDVEVLEHDRMLFLRRHDGAIAGESRFSAPFPAIKVNMDDADQHVWALDKSEVEHAIGVLVSGAAWDDNRLHFEPGDKGEINLSMVGLNGKKIVAPVSCSEQESGDKAPPVPDAGFAIDHFCLARVLKSWEGELVRFGVNSSGTRGFVRFVSEREGDKYLTIIGWLH